MTFVTNVAFVMLALAAGLCLARIARPGSIADRAIGIDTLVSVFVGGVAVQTARTQSGAFVVVLVVTTLLGFVGTVTVARFIERRGA